MSDGMVTLVIPSTMSWNIAPVGSAGELRRFIHLPALLPGRRANYVPPIWRDEVVFHDPRKNPELRVCRHVRFLAWGAGRPVGRVMGIIHDPYNVLMGERTARFHQLASVDDASVVRELLLRVEQWAREQGMDRMIGPFGLSDKDPQGLQVEGFEHLPVLATATNPAYLPDHVEACGYGKRVDALVYRVGMPHSLPPMYERLAQRVLSSGRFRMVPIRHRRDLRSWILPVLELVNVSYAGLLGFMPMDRATMQHLGDQYLPVLDPAFVKILVDEGDRPVAFVVAMPDMSEGIKRAKGHLFPFGFLHVLAAMRRSRQLDLFLGAVHPHHQGRGLTAVLAMELMAEARRRGMTHLDSHLVLETNSRMRAELERLGGVVWKRYRIYEKHL